MFKVMFKVSVFSELLPLCFHVGFFFHSFSFYPSKNMYKNRVNLEKKLWRSAVLLFFSHCFSDWESN